MRAALTSLALLFAPTALAQQAPERPELPAPQATASFEAREDWCEKYASWFVSSAPGATTAAPYDIGPTHRYEVEFNACKLDPQQYERDTLAELAQSAEEATAPG